MIQRTLEMDFSQALFRGKILVLYGPRQVGKTTLVRKVLEKRSENQLWLSGDEADVRRALSDTNRTTLAGVSGKAKIVVIDEAQRISNIGLTLKLADDFLPEVQVIATGSSSFELANQINEPLTGRKKQFTLYPISFTEMVAQESLFEEKRLLERRLLYGSYPEIITHPGEEEELLRDLAESYLYKDVFSFEQLRKPELLFKLLQALALQIGSEVKNAELARFLGVDNETIERYINLLEKAFIIFRLPSLNRNIRSEIKKGKKIYFFDLGMRNYIINNFNPLEVRNDVGGLWENWLILERRKMLEYSRKRVNSYFWRTMSQQEIDYIEDSGGTLEAWEFKWSSKTGRSFPPSFLEAYPGSKTTIIHRDSFEEFLLLGDV